MAMNYGNWVVVAEANHAIVGIDFVSHLEDGFEREK